jgi:hypothetical protein
MQILGGSGQPHPALILCYYCVAVGSPTIITQALQILGGSWQPHPAHKLCRGGSVQPHPALKLCYYCVPVGSPALELCRYWVAVGSPPSTQGPQILDCSEQSSPSTQTLLILDGSAAVPPPPIPSTQAMQILDGSEQPDQAHKHCRYWEAVNSPTQQPISADTGWQCIIGHVSLGSTRVNLGKIPVAFPASVS